MSCHGQFNKKEFFFGEPFDSCPFYPIEQLFYRVIQPQIGLALPESD